MIQPDQPFRRPAFRARTRRAAALGPIAAAAPALVASAVLAVGAAACSGAASSQPGGNPPVVVQQPPARFGYRIVHTYPHDPRAFTQGLLFQDGVLYESTGQNGRSSLRRVELETGKVLQKHDVDERYFAEGLAGWDRQLIQLTWQAGRAFVYDRDTFAEVKTHAYSGEGWGLTGDGTKLIMSDGSSTLRFLDPATFAETARVSVRDTGVPVRDLNELEYVDGEIFANVWHADRIARIDPASGAVKGWVEMAGLLAPGDVTDPEAVLNGIAWDAASRRLFVTGKLWPKLFEVEIVPK